MAKHFLTEVIKKITNRTVTFKVEPEVCETTTDNGIVVGADVLVFDRYRFAKPLTATVVQFSEANDGVEIRLKQSNNYKWPIGCLTWVHKSQLQLVTFNSISEGK